MNRRLLIALIAAVIASQLLLWWLRPNAPPPRSAGPPRSDYSLHNFKLEVLDHDGAVGFALRAPRLQKRNADGTLFIRQPTFRIPGADDNTWRGRADRGRVNAKGTELKLAGDVSLQRPPDTHVHTERLTAWPQQNRLASDTKTEIRQPGRILTGVGMRADLATHTLELLAHVHGTFQPDAGD